LSGSRSLVTSATDPSRAQRRAQVRPAMPLPRTRKSVSTGTGSPFPCPGGRVKVMTVPDDPERSGTRYCLTSTEGSRIVIVMPRAKWGLVVLVAGGLALAAPAHADIYLYRDRFGVLHFTNAPSDGGARMLVKERAVPAAPRMLVPAAYYQPSLERLPSVAPTSYDALIREIADRYDVEYALVKAVIKAESDFDRLAVSPKGALGLMQLMPATAAQHQVRDVFLPRDNIEGGVRHLRLLLDRYGGNVPLTVAAYNAGSQRVEDAGGIPPIPETREYLARVLRY